MLPAGKPASSDTPRRCRRKDAVHSKMPSPFETYSIAYLSPSPSYLMRGDASGARPLLPAPKQRLHHVPHVPVISVVDDDASVRAATTRLLKSLGLTAHAFAVGKRILTVAWFARHVVPHCRRADAWDERGPAARILDCARSQHADHLHYCLPGRQHPGASDERQEPFASSASPSMELD